VVTNSAHNIITETLLGNKQPNSSEVAEVEVNHLSSNLGYENRVALRSDLLERMLRKRLLDEYNEVFTLMEGEKWFRFMNHGYLTEPDEMPAIAKLTLDDQRWLHQIALYFLMIERYTYHSGIVDLSSVDILDVGCGRGGGLSAVVTYFGAFSAIGVDINERQVEFCSSVHNDNRLAFLVGDASKIPLPDNSADLVLNVESCHGYPNPVQFLHECRRVLRPGGLLLLTDVRLRGAGEQILDLDILTSGFGVLERADITEKVQAACSLDAKRFTSRHFGSDKAEVIKRTAVKKAHEYASGRMAYLYYVLSN